MTAIVEAVEQLVAALRDASDPELGRPWAWGPYDAEGVRFALLRSAEELRELAAVIAVERVAGEAPLSLALTQLGQWTAAYYDMRGALLGLTDADADCEPAANEWGARQVLSHVLEADFGFFVTVAYALEQQRAGNVDPARAPEAYWLQVLGDEAEFSAMLAQPLTDLLDSYGTAHGLVTMAFSGITDAETQLPSRYWEGEPFPIGFRLGRFGSHTRQHIAQVDGLRTALGLHPTEAHRLGRQLYGALATLEAALLGVEYLRDQRVNALAQIIAGRAAELRGVAGS